MGGTDRKLVVRGKVDTFSIKSRIRLLQTFGQIREPIHYWVDLTFADSTLRGKSSQEISQFASERMRVFSQWLRRKYPADSWAIWKREWQPRKSGSLIDVLCPHYHLFLHGIDKDDLWYILQKWVDNTGVQGEDRAKALQVAFHKKSYRKISSQKQAQRYVTKYGSKNTEAIGRSWGKIGNVPLEEGMEMKLTLEQRQKVRRILRAYTKRTQAKNKDKRFKLTNRLKSDDFEGFIMIPERDLLRIIEYVKREVNYDKNRITRQDRDHDMETVSTYGKSRSSYETRRVPEVDGQSNL
ncbi:hypothetical protein EG832_13720 [bacterium]|nr:hypothetical protein [bacterium]